jgi:hypothetical protein
MDDDEVLTDIEIVKETLRSQVDAGLLHDTFAYDAMQRIEAELERLRAREKER